MSDFEQQVVWFTPGRPARHPTLPQFDHDATGPGRAD